MKEVLGNLLIVLITLVLSGCSSTITQESTPTTPGGEFAIYLPAHDFRAAETTDISQIELMEEAILTMDDIVWYAADTHEIELEQSATNRFNELELPGKYFAVTLNQQPIYTGEFMAAYMSRSSDKVVILWPPMNGDEQVIKIQLGYPGADFFTGPDPRNDSRILEAFKRAGKLR